MDIECEGWSNILEIYPDMDFSAELTKNPALSDYMRGALNFHSQGLETPNEMSDAPKLDSDFSKWVLLNGLPKCNEEKSKKLTKLIIKLFDKKQFNVAEEMIQHHFNDNEEKPETTGQCFILMKNDEQAKIAAAIFNGHQLDKKHTFSACTFPDFNKIMAQGE